MTCIVGYVDKINKNVVIGGDSASIDGLSITVRKDPKVFKVGEFIFGCTSSFRMIQLLRFSLKLQPKIDSVSIYEYMCTEFIKNVRQCFKDGGYLQHYSDGDEKSGVFLVGYKDRLFKIDEDFQVAEPYRDFDAIGCGGEYALGSIYSTSKTNAVDIVKDALECAQFFSCGVEKPFVTIST